MSERKILEYVNVYLEYEYYNDSGCRSSSLADLRENFDENMKEFDAVVNERLEEGWHFHQIGFACRRRNGSSRTFAREKYRTRYCRRGSSRVRYKIK